MKRLKKISLQGVSDILSEKELKDIRGGYYSSWDCYSGAMYECNSTDPRFAPLEENVCATCPEEAKNKFIVSFFTETQETLKESEVHYN